jgi:hypothetical protein
MENTSDSDSDSDSDSQAVSIFSFSQTQTSPFLFMTFPTYFVQVPDSSLPLPSGTYSFS